MKTIIQLLIVALLANAAYQTARSYYSFYDYRSSLTEEGQLFYEHAIRILSEVDDAEFALTQRHQAPRGRLRIDVPIALGRLHILPVLQRFLNRWPEVEAEVSFSDEYRDIVGDGTSGSTVLAHAIFADGVRNVVAGASAIDLKRGLDRAAKVVIENLKSMSRPVTTRKEKAQIGAISAHNDQAIGEMVADAMEKVGNDGVIAVEESKTTETVLEVVEGMQFDRGFISP